MEKKAYLNKTSGAIFCISCLAVFVVTFVVAALPALAGGAVTGSFSVRLGISNLAVNNISDSGAIISWQTNGLSDSMVEYGTNATYGFIKPQAADNVSNHTVVLTGLAAGTLYHYRATSVAAADTAVSPDNTFTTLADTGPPVTTTTDTTTTTSTTTTATTTTPPPISATGQAAWTPAANGTVPTTVNVGSSDNKSSVTIPKGTQALDKAGKPLTAITCNPPPAPAPAPPAANILAAYEFGPSGATFATPITIEMKYDPAAIPAGLAESGLVIAFFDAATGNWVPLGNIIIDTVNHAISCQTNHFTEFAVISAPKQVQTSTTATTTTTTGTTTTTAGAKTIRVKVTDPDGNPITAQVTLFEDKQGLRQQVATSQTGTLTANVPAGQYIANAYIGNEMLAVQTVDMTTGSNTRDTTLIVKTAYFAAFSIVPVYDETTHNLKSAAINYNVRNLYQPMSQITLNLKVSRDGTPVEDIQLESFAQLNVGDTGGSSNYTPPQGWQSGTYTFQAELFSGEKLYNTTLEEKLVVPSPNAVRLVLIAQFIAAGVVVIIGVVLLILIRRRRMLKNSEHE